MNCALFEGGVGGLEESESEEDRSWFLCRWLEEDLWKWSISVCLTFFSAFSSVLLFLDVNMVEVVLAISRRIITKEK